MARERKHKRDMCARKLTRRRDRTRLKKEMSGDEYNEWLRLQMVCMPFCQIGKGIPYEDNQAKPSAWLNRSRSMRSRVT